MKRMLLWIEDWWPHLMFTVVAACCIFASYQVWWFVQHGPAVSLSVHHCTFTYADGVAPIQVTTTARGD